MARLVPFFLVAALMMGCGPKTKRLSAVEQDHYYALKVFMDKDLEKAFLKEKTEEERNAVLKAAGMWDRFYQYDAAMREAIVAGEVGLGWTEDRMFMSWGNPIDRRRMTGRPASRSEMFTYRFEVDTHGVVRLWTPKSKTAYQAVHQYEIDVVVDDQRITEMVKRDKW